jgi:uncharacterized membrane protein YoaK (UPF0700 family)
VVTTGPAVHTIDQQADRLLLRTMLALTFSTGIVDAAGYLALHHVFVANMTGNVVLLALGEVDHGELSPARSLLALGGFLIGAAISGRLLRDVDAKRRCPPRCGWLLVTVALVLLALTGVALIPDPSTALLDVTTAVFAGAMGLQAAVARRLGVAEVTTVVITSTITALASANPLTGGDPKGLTGRRIGAVAGMLLGALAGALLVKIDLSVPIAVAALIVIAVAVLLLRFAAVEKAWSKIPS